MKKKLLFLLCVSAIFTCTVISFGAGKMSIEIQPTRIEALLPKMNSGAIEILNTGEQSAMISAATCDWDMDNTGNLIFTNALPKNDSSCAGWIMFNPRIFKIEAGKRQIVRFRITPPAGKRFAESRGGILFKAQPFDANDQIRKYGSDSVANVAVTVYCEFPGVQRKGGILNATARYDPKQKTVTSALEVESTGTAHIRFDGSFTIKNKAGKALGDGHYPGSVALPGKKLVLTALAKPNLAPGIYTVESVLKFKSALYIEDDKLSEYPDNMTQLASKSEFVVK